MGETGLSPNSTPTRDGRGKAPVFVVGCPRSGTTLLYHMLLSAGNFAVYRAESQVFNLLEPRFGDLKIASNKRRLLTAWQKSDLFRRTGLSIAEIEPELMKHCQNGGDFLRIVMEAMARQQNVQRWADCTPEHLLYLDRIRRTIPGALVIHIIRDGRDVALSLERQRWIKPLPWHRSKNLEAAALYWDWIVQRGRSAAKRLGTDYMEVRYEDLVKVPRETLARVGDFVGQPLDYDQIQDAGVGSVRQPNSSFEKESAREFNPVGRWRNLSAPKLATIEALLKTTLMDLGYPLSGAEPAKALAQSPAAMRLAYRRYFDSKLLIKKNTSLGKIFVTRDLASL